MNVSKQNNNIGGIPKLSSSSTISTINAKSLIGTFDGTTFIPGQLLSAFGPGQGLGALSPGNWFSPNEVLKIMKSVRFFYETPDIQAYFVALIGAAGPYTYEIHKTHFDLDINIDSQKPGCGGIYDSHLHVKGLALGGLICYATPISTTLKGENNCANLDGSNNDYVPPFGYGPPILYREFVAPNGSAGADLEWSIIMNDYGPRPDIMTYGYPPYTSHSTGADIGAGIDLYHLVDPGITCDGRLIAPGVYNYPPDDFYIKPGYIKPKEVDWTLQPFMWQAVSDELMSYYPQDYIIDDKGHQHLAQPSYDAFQIAPTIVDFPFFLIPYLSEPYFGSANFMIYILAQAFDFLAGSSAFDEWIALAKAQKHKFAATSIHIYVDTGYLYANGCGMSPGLVANSVNVVSDFCDQLRDCGFFFGGAVDFMYALDLVPDMKKSIDLWLQYQPNSQPVGPTPEQLKDP